MELISSAPAGEVVGSQAFGGRHLRNGTVLLVEGHGRRCDVPLNPGRGEQREQDLTAWYSAQRRPWFLLFPALFTDKPLSSLGEGKGWGRWQVPRWHEAGHVPGHG